MLYYCILSIEIHDVAKFLVVVSKNYLCGWQMSREKKNLLGIGPCPGMFSCLENGFHIAWILSKSGQAGTKEVF